MKRGKRNRKVKRVERDDIFRKLRIYNYRRGLLSYHKHIGNPVARLSIKLKNTLCDLRVMMGPQLKAFIEQGNMNESNSVQYVTGKCQNLA
jgi:hypothetical protein